MRPHEETAHGPCRILVVDDEPEVRSVLRRGLEAERFEVTEAGSVVALFKRIEEDRRISLVTLDLSLGNDDGLALATKLRATRNVPIVMITGRSTPLDRVVGLEHGADDYIVKPFHIREALIRIRAVLRRYALERAEEDATNAAAAGGERYAFAAGVLDVRRRELVAPGGARIELTDAEHDVLALLLRQAGRVMTRDEIMLQLRRRHWSPLDRSIDGVIARLRKKLEPRLDAPCLIRTVWGVGYVFAGDVAPAARD